MEHSDDKTLFIEPKKEKPLAIETAATNGPWKMTDDATSTNGPAGPREYYKPCKWRPKPTPGAFGGKAKKNR